METKKPKVSYKGRRAKGAVFEKLIVDALDELGLPSQKVLGSGKFGVKGSGAAGDIKVGITLNPDGTKPPPDETPCLLRIEAKNHAVNPYYDENTEVEAVYAIATKPTTEALFKHLNQDKVSKAVILRRSKVPPGALKDKRWDDIAMVCMGLEQFATLIKLAYGIKEPKKKK